MDDDNQQFAYFSLVGEFDPSDITERVGVPPTEGWRRGDVGPTPKMVRKSSGWNLYSRLGRDQKLESHVRDVLGQLGANPDAFQKTSLEFGGCMKLVGYFYRDYPGLIFDREITSGLAHYALSVDFDFYWLPSAPEVDRDQPSKGSENR